MGFEITTPFLFYESSPSTDTLNLKLQEEKILKQQLENLSLRERRIKEAYESGIDTLSEYRENKLRIQEQKHELENKLHHLLLPVPQPPSFPSALSSFDELFQNPQIPNEKKRVFSSPSPMKSCLIKPLIRFILILLFPDSIYNHL